jgi:hypothetical protein
MKLVLLLKQMNINCVLFPITFESLISRARNAAVAHFLSNTDNTHIMFIDADIEFNPEDVMKLVFTRKDVICGAYAQKWLDTSRVKDVVVSGLNLQSSLDICTKTSVHLIDNHVDSSKIRKVEYATTGFLLCQRNAFEAMIGKYPERKYRNDIDGYAGAHDELFYDFFPVQINPDTRRFESEDYGFSRLWREIGGEIYVMTDINLKHHGWFAYPANLQKQLEFATATTVLSMKETPKH